MLLEHFIYNSFSHYWTVPFEILRYSLIYVYNTFIYVYKYIYLHALQGPFYKNCLLCHMISPQKLECDEAVSIFIFSILPPIDDHLLETKGHLIHICTMAFSKGLIQRRHWYILVECVNGIGPGFLSPPSLRIWISASRIYLLPESSYFSILMLLPLTLKSNLLFKIRAVNNLNHRRYNHQWDFSQLS